MAENQERDRNFEEKVVQVSRVSKKTKGGNKMGFSVLMVVGDRQGRVGVGLGKAKDVLGAIRKGVRKAKKRMFVVPMDGTTIPFPVEIKDGAARVMLRPAPRGSGVIAGGPIRAVVEAAGIRDISAKILGSSNKAANVQATFRALRHIYDIVELRDISLKSVADEEREQKALEREEQRKAKEQVAEKAEEKAEAAKEEVKAEAKKAVKKPAAKKAPAKKAAPKAKTKETKTETVIEAPAETAAPEEAQAE